MNIDLAIPAIQQDPYPTYAQMRQQPSIALVDHAFAGKNTHFISRYQDAVAVLKDPRFANDARRLPTWNDWTKKWYIPSMFKVFMHTLALKDEPDHTRLKVLVHKAFTPSMIQQMSGRVEQVTNDLLDAAAGKSIIDFVDQFALPLPLTIIGDMLGVSLADRANFRRWMANTIADFSPNDLLGALPKMRNAFALDGFLKRLVAERRRQPQNDLTSALVQTREAEDSLSEDELIAMLFLMLFAGHETTVSLISMGTLALLQHPDQFEKLKANPGLMDSAIEEMLRYCNPTQHIAIRYALEDVQVGGTLIPRYSAVLVGIASANRDETVFEKADTFDITRDPNRHIAFGFGIHYCLGAPLSRMEAKIAFTALLRRFPNMQLAAPTDQLKWRGGPPLRGLVRLPVQLA